MKSPFTGGTCTLMHETREVTYRKEKFEYVAQYWICDDTGEEFTTTDQDGASLAQVYNSYREKFGIPYPDEFLVLALINGGFMSKGRYRVSQTGE